MKHMNVKLSSMIGVLTFSMGAYLYLAFAASRAAGSDTKSQSRAVAAPAWELKDVDGKPVKLADFKGKVIILDFWATWCGPCRMEIPGFVELQKSFGNQGLAVVGVSLDEEGGPVVKPFMAKFHVNYPIVMGNKKIVRDYGNIEAIPTAFVIDRQGRIANKHVGYVDKTQFEREIKPLLTQ